MKVKNNYYLDVTISFLKDSSCFEKKLFWCIQNITSLIRFNYSLVSQGHPYHIKFWGIITTGLTDN
jgi:hypothetical protein